MARKRTTDPLAARITFVYRAFGTRGELVYVGISQDWRARIEGHRKGSPWWKYVQHIEIQEFPNRTEAFAMESWAIANEVPLGNTELQEKHCPPHPPTPTVSFGQWVHRSTMFSDRDIPAQEVNIADSEYQTGVLALG